MHTPRNNVLRNIGLVLASALLLTACGKKKIDDLPPPADGTGGYSQGGNDTGGYGTDGGPIVPGSQRDFVNTVGMGNDRVLFDTDRYNIDSRDMATLQTQAQWLSRNPASSVTIEGHADERGTRDYNLALGERRANAAKNYLVSLGIARNRIRTVSYGKESPEALGSSESAWAQNRRAVTVVVE